MANLASTLDGVVAFEGGGPSSGGSAVTGLDPRDRMLMGLLRAVSDAVVVGAGTLRAVPRHTWTAAAAFPPLAEDYARLRVELGLPAHPRLVVVSASGALDLRLPAFHRPQGSALVVTTPRGKARLLAGAPSELGQRGSALEVWAGGEGPRLRPETVLRGLSRRARPRRVLIEGGPSLLTAFLGKGLLDDLFLTVAPQLAGRDPSRRRLALVEGRTFGPEHPLMARLTGVRKGGHLLFLRYELGPSPLST